MSLNSAGHSITITTDERPFDAYDNVQLDKMPEVYVYTENCSLEGSKAAFLKAMEEFANTPHFRWLTYGFESEFQLKVNRSVTLSMNR